MLYRSILILEGDVSEKELYRKSKHTFYVQ